MANVEVNLPNDTRYEDYKALVKKLAGEEAKAGTSLIKIALGMVRESASGVIDDYAQVKEVYELFRTTSQAAAARAGHVKPGKPMGKKVKEIQISKLANFFYAGQIKDIRIESIENDKLIERDLTGETAMDHVVRLYKDMGPEALNAYVAYTAAAGLLKTANKAGESVTDAELQGVMSKTDKAKKAKTAKDWITQARDILGDVMKGAKKKEQCTDKEVSDAHAILDKYLAHITLREEHDKFLIRAKEVGLDVARLEKAPRSRAGRTRSQRKG